MTSVHMSNSAESGAYTPPMNCDDTANPSIAISKSPCMTVTLLHEFRSAPDPTLMDP